jgi:hypothetical protein
MRGERLDFMQKELVSAGGLARPIDLEKMVDKGAREHALAAAEAICALTRSN